MRAMPLAPFLYQFQSMDELEPAAMSPITSPLPFGRSEG
jgi:hypothetical protein